MNIAELDDDYSSCKISGSSDTDEFKTPTNGSNLVKFNLEPADEPTFSTNKVETEEQEDQDVTLDEASINTGLSDQNNQINELSNDNKQGLLNSYSHSLPQFPIHPSMNYLNTLYINNHHGNTMSNLNTYFNPTSNLINNFNDPNNSNLILNYQNDDKENQHKHFYGLYNDFKLNQFNFHSLETFGFFIRYTLNLGPELVKEILSNHKIQHWIDRNKTDGFVYNLFPKTDESKHRIPVVRCELCKFYGHLSHNCSIKELSFKLYNVALKSGACRCHICGQLGHPAEAGLCPYIACSFCRQFGHWNHMCPNIDKVSRTLCYKCQRYGHKTERCPDQWRQFDRISTFEQTPYKDPSETNKPVYCYQCAKKGHYGHNCPDFYRKYFIRDNHQLNPVYFFAGSSPFVKYPVDITEIDKKQIKNLIETQVMMDFNLEQDPIEQLENYQNRLRNENKLPPLILDNFNLFNESTSQPHPSSLDFKRYIRKWSNWVIDFNWIFSLKFLSEYLTNPKLFFLIKNYPILDNFILYWMWWSHILNQDLESLTKDSFRGIGSMPWLSNDINNNNIKKKKKNLNNKKSKKNLKKNKSSNNYLSDNNTKSETETEPEVKKNDCIDSNSNYQEQKKYNFSYKKLHLINTSSWLNKKCSSLCNSICELEEDRLNKTDLNFEETVNYLKLESIKLASKINSLKPKSSNMFKSKSMFLSQTIFDLNAEEEDLENTIVYLDKEKLKQNTQPVENTTTEIIKETTNVTIEASNDNELKQVEDNEKIDSTEALNNDTQYTENNTDSTSQTNVLDKFIKSFSSSASNESNQEDHKTANNENINKLIDFLKKKNDKQIPALLDHAPTVEQIETEILAPTIKLFPCETIEKQKQSDSADLIKLLLKIDKTKPLAAQPPASLNILDKLTENKFNKLNLIQNDEANLNLKLNLLDMIKSSVNSQTNNNNSTFNQIEQSSNLINKILANSNCTPINIDIANQQLFTNSCVSSSSGSCISLSSLSSSISPQNSILSSNSSPNSSNSSTAKPNNDSSFSTSISSSKSIDQVSSSSISLSSSSSSVSLEFNNKQIEQQSKPDLNNINMNNTTTSSTLNEEKKLDPSVEIINKTTQQIVDNKSIPKQNSKLMSSSLSTVCFKSNSNKAKQANSFNSSTNPSSNASKSNNQMNLNRQLSLNNYQNRTLNNSKLAYSSYNLKQPNQQYSNNFRNNNLNLHGSNNRQQFFNFNHSSISNQSLINNNNNSNYKRSCSNTSLIQFNSKFPKSNSIPNSQAGNYRYEAQQNNYFSIQTQQPNFNNQSIQPINWTNNNSIQNFKFSNNSSNRTGFNHNPNRIDKKFHNNTTTNTTNTNTTTTTNNNNNNNNNNTSGNNNIQNQSGYISSLLQFQQIYQNNSTSSNNSSSTTPSNSFSINTNRSNSSTPNNFVQNSNMHKHTSNLIQNYNNFKKSQSNNSNNTNNNSISVTNNNNSQINFRQNNNFSNLNNYNNHQNHKKNYKKQIP